MTTTSVSLFRSQLVRALLVVFLFFVVLIQSTGESRAKGFEGVPDYFGIISDSRSLEDHKFVVRSLLESCFAVGAAGAAAALLVGTPIIVNGIGAPSIAAVVLGAAGVGCVSGIAAASAQMSLNHLWRRPDTLETKPMSNDGFADRSKQGFKTQFIKSVQRLAPDGLDISPINLWIQTTQR